MALGFDTGPAECARSGHWFMPSVWAQAPLTLKSVRKLPRSWGVRAGALFWGAGAGLGPGLRLDAPWGLLKASLLGRPKNARTHEKCPYSDGWLRPSVAPS